MFQDVFMTIYDHIYNAEKNVVKRELNEKKKLNIHIFTRALYMQATESSIKTLHNRSPKC